jgi:hypothetical protein
MVSTWPQIVIWLQSLSHGRGGHASAQVTHAQLSLFQSVVAGRHSLDKSSYIPGEILIAVVLTIAGERSPTALDLAPCFHTHAFTGLNANVPLEQFGRDRFGLRPNVGGVAA